MIVPVIAGIASALKIAGSIFGAQDQQRKLREQAQALERARALTMDQARITRAVGQLQGGRIRVEGSAAIASEQAALAAGNVQTSYGTSVHLAGQRRLVASMEMMQVQNNAARVAWGLKQKADQFGAQAQRARERGDRIMKGAILGSIAQAVPVVGPMIAQAVSGLGGVQDQTPTSSAPAYDPSSVAPFGSSEIEAWQRKWGYSWQSFDAVQGHRSGDFNEMPPGYS